MPHTTRERALRQIRMASGNMDVTLEHLLKVKMVYEEPHPEIAQTIEAVMIAVVQVQELVKGLLKTF